MNLGDRRRASLLARMVLVTAVVTYGWACGASPLAASMLASVAAKLLPRPAATRGVPPDITPGVLSPAFRPEVLRWEPQILSWSETHHLDPNLVATVMQIESCGDPYALSPAGATGLFQVMPFHFAPGDDMQDPQTNADRGLAFLADGLDKSGGDVGLALAAYNGGQALIDLPTTSWPGETQRYYEWGTGLYNDVRSGLNPSPTLERWLQSGGESLCRTAAAR